MNSIFLGGGNGFLGKHIQANFKDKYQIIAPTRQELPLTNSDAVERYLSNSGKIDCIINATHSGVSNGADNTTENLYSFCNIFQYSKNVKTLIHFGSGSEYSKPFHKAPMHEEDAGIVIPKDAYGISKFFIGQFLERQERGKYVNLRIFGIFGLHEDYRLRFISNAIVRSLLDLPIIVNQDAIFDYVYINDFVRILDYFIEHPAPHISYNITTGNPITLIELAKAVHTLTNNRHQLVIKNYLLKENYTGNNKRLTAFLPNSFEFTPIRIAIFQLIQQYELHLSQLNKENLEWIREQA